MGKYKNEDPNKGFYDLIKKSPQKSNNKNINVNVNLEELKENTGFQSPHDVDKKIDDIFNQEGKSKREKHKREEYKSRSDEARKSKYSKSNYILKHGFGKKNKEDEKIGLFILAADINMAFYDWDMIYRMYRSNAQYEQEQNRLARRTKNDIKEDCINEILLKESGKNNINKMEIIDRMRIELYKKLLHEIAKMKNPIDWLYQGKHMGITQENKNDNMSIVDFELADGEIYTDPNKNVEENESKNVEFPQVYKESVRYANYKIKRKEFTSQVFDYERCRISFRKEFKKCLIENELNLITPEFCDIFINNYLIPYLIKVEKVENNRAEKSKKNIRKVIKKYKEDIEASTKISKKRSEVTIRDLEQVIEIKTKDLESGVEKAIKDLKESVKRRVENFEDDVKKADSDQKDRMSRIIDDLNKNIERTTSNLRTNVKKLTNEIRDDTEKAIGTIRGSQNCKKELVKYLEEYEEGLIEKLEEKEDKIIENVKEELENLMDNTKENINNMIGNNEELTKRLKRHMGTLNNKMDMYTNEIAAILEEFVKKLDGDPKEDRKRINEEFPKFLKRYNELSSLNEKFEKSKKNNDDLKNSYKKLIRHLESRSNKGNKELRWGTKENMLDEASGEIIINVKNEIRKFFDHLAMNKELDEKNFNLVENRIRWIDENVFIEGDKPIFLIGMVMRFGPNFLPNKKMSKKIYDLFQPCASYKGYKKSEKVLYGKLRYELIRLLDKFHDIYDLNIDERVHSWNDFFCYEGRDILSSDEANFWREYLGSEYDKLPAVGFQLYFVDCTESCMPIYREYLQSYKKIGRAIKEYMDCLKGVKNFYDEENEEIIKAINECDNTKGDKTTDVTKRFQEVWNDPSYDSYYYYEFLRPYLKYFLHCSVMQKFPNERCKVLELEVILRTYQNRQAKNKMYEWFKKIYGCPLDHIVNAAKHSAERQAVYEGC